MRKFRFTFLFTFIVFSWSNIALSAAYFSTLDELSFGELMGFPGSCEMDALTGDIGNQTGSFCLYDKKGTVGSYLIVSSAYKVISIKINRRMNSGDGITFIPSGVYQVSGEADIAILPDQLQNINTGDTGILHIKLGGSLRSNQALSFSSLFTFTNIAGIEWDELP
ncbi:hypothetical protein [Colwellia sp. C1TZA3]|uniref:hypothetical protein n=1 Tax=Colwellia sp. C1TZA3 TaxID=2508879 RepID=UPI0011B9BAFC|nr:hypothetical protein [Colwellia sp. C1TZA3]TWX67483.1 hypothetical protein ESZ39_13400 [Colwellia sp. C1TZA3]